MLLYLLLDPNKCRVCTFLSIPPVVSSVLLNLSNGSTTIDLHKLLLEIETTIGSLIFAPELQDIHLGDTSIFAEFKHCRFELFEVNWVFTIWDLSKFSNCMVNLFFQEAMESSEVRIIGTTFCTDAWWLLMECCCVIQASLVNALV